MAGCLFQANKDPAAIITALKDKLASISVLPVPGHEHHGVEAFGPTTHSAPTMEAALSGLSIDPAKEIVLIAVTLYLAGAVLRANYQIPD